MEIQYTKEKIIFNKELRSIDEFVSSFLRYLDKNKIKYVLISGYSALFFGRERNTEDIDLFVEDLNERKFLEFWKDVSKEFECLNAKSAEGAYLIFTSERIALRFHKQGSFIPNIEFKPLKSHIDRYTLEQRIEIECNGKILYFSRPEIQIPYKIFLGSEKDIEDARFLYKLLKNYLNMDDLKEMLATLGIKNNKFEILMGEKLE
ncbi:nucleotidyltransferase [Candidatus Micrarchaeota archaeon]|nr:nucleotidyltransferase [Candidatus Micrarchaeota archaeon]